jgi:hypothetical protein
LPRGGPRALVYPRFILKKAVETQITQIAADQVPLSGFRAITRRVSDSLSPGHCIQSAFICEICVK